MALPAIACALSTCGASAAVPSTLRGVDPNTAPWWELTLLPRVGEGTAREIILYRQSVTESPAEGRDDRPFRAAADLERVRGIGPVTVRRITPYLRFQYENHRR